MERFEIRSSDQGPDWWCIWDTTEDRPTMHMPPNKEVRKPPRKLVRLCEIANEFEDRRIHNLFNPKGI